MNEHFNRNDETLVELTLLGDGTAYEELVTRHQRAVMGTAYKVTKNKCYLHISFAFSLVKSLKNNKNVRIIEIF